MLEDEAQRKHFDDAFSGPYDSYGDHSSSRHPPQPSTSTPLLPQQQPDKFDDSVREPETSVPRRFRTKKVELFHGNFVLDNPVPNKLLAICPNRTEREFTHMRYSAATCDPNDFSNSGFTLRQLHYEPDRRTELFIGITMCDEDEVLFCRSMHGVMKNIAHLCRRERSRVWGRDSPKKVVVCIVSDGRGKINPRTLSVITMMGVYQKDVLRTRIGRKDVTAHLYEYTTQISVNPSLETKVSETGVVPVQIIFCLKEKSQGKVNSHRWFFNAFGPILQPNICILLDTGAMPGPTSIYHLWKAFDISSNLGGACGEVVVFKGKFWKNLVNPLVAAQNSEYKLSHILDKSLESVFGYITVLSSTFSGYRYIAVQNDRNGEGPLQKYFLGEALQDSYAGNFVTSMGLPVDHTLCWELVSKRGCSWVVHYVKSAYAEIPVPDRVHELITQQSRRPNGSFLAAVHSTVHFYNIYRSDHTFIRKVWIHIGMLYHLVDLTFSWFSLANFYITFAILTESLEDPSFNLSGIQIANRILTCLYLALVFASFCLSLLNRRQDFKVFSAATPVGFAVVVAYMIVAVILLGFKGISTLVKEKEGMLSFVDLLMDPTFRNIVLGLASTLGLYVVSSLIFFEPFHMITSFAQYVLLVPYRINVLNVYAFSNVHNISRVTNGSNGPLDLDPPHKHFEEHYDDAVHFLGTKKSKQEMVNENRKKEAYYSNLNFWANGLLAWVVSNSILAVAITSTNPKAANAGANAALGGYMSFLIYWLALLAAVRFIGSSMYMIIRLFAGE